MKKIYASLALALAAITGAQAQTSLPQVDLQSLVVIDSNQVLPATAAKLCWYCWAADASPGDSILAVAGSAVGRNGVGLVSGDQFFYADVTNGEFSATGGLYGSVYTLNANVDTNRVLTINRDISKTDSIMSLLNIVNYEADSTKWADILVVRANLVNNKTYGWWSYATVWPSDGSAAYRDTIRGNNLDYTPVIWVTGSGIKGAFSTNYDQLALYPNPANNMVSYDLDLKKASQSKVVRVLDMTGRAVLTENTGSIGVGKSTHQLDISSLPAGNYNIQVITEYSISATKFVKN